jgi:hypothetical protein
MERQGAPAKSLEEEKRLRAMEQQLPVTVSGFTENPSDVSVENSVPQVVGLSITSGLRNLTAKWNDAHIPQASFDYYEIQISTSPSFPSSGLVIDKTQDLQYTYYAGNPNTTYYAKVRAVLNDGRTGDFSSTVNLTTGLAVAGDFTPESIIVPSVAFSSTTQNVPIAGAEVVIQTLVVTLTNKPVLLLAAFQHTHTIAGSQARQPVFLKRDSVSILDFFAYINSTGDNAVCFTFIDEAPGSGTITYTLEYDNNLAGGGNDAVVSNRLLTAIELKK